jgi:hypothetical protein
MTSIKAPHSFISFSSKDEKRARAICDEMELRHVPCWISSRDVRPGRNYQSEIIDALEHATHLILVFSANSNRSEEVARELSLASKKKIPICPVRIENIQPTGGMEFMLATSQWVDAFDKFQNAMDRLASEINGSTVLKIAVERTAVSHVLPVLVGGLALAVVAAGGMAAYLSLTAPANAPAASHATVMAVPPPPPGGLAMPARRAPAFAPGYRQALPKASYAYPATAATAVPSEGSMASVEKLAASLQCAHVVVGSAGSGDITLSGFVQSAADEERLLESASGHQVQNDLTVSPPPFCEVRGLGPAYHATDDVGIDINHTDGHYVFGDSLEGSFTPPGDGQHWVEADLIQFDGSVLHVIPDPGRPRMVNAGETVRFGAPPGQKGNIMAGEPAGTMLLVVISSDRPLPPPISADESISTYLPSMRSAFSRLHPRLAISTRDITVSRAQN